MASSGYTRGASLFCNFKEGNKKRQKELWVTHERLLGQGTMFGGVASGALGLLTCLYFGCLSGKMKT